MSEAIVLDNGILRAKVLPYGAILQSLLVPDCRGILRDVVLGCDRPEDYAAEPDYLGAVVGRCANRVAGASFKLGDKTYELSRNFGKHHIHGGFCGFSAREWTIVSSSAKSVRLCLLSADGEEGYPGELEVFVTYRLEKKALRIEYEALSNQETLCNLTNHSYFNLDGHTGGSVREQYIAIFAERYLPTDDDGVPIGSPADVVGTPMDLRKPSPIGLHLRDTFWQLAKSRGYDHCYIIDGKEGQLKTAARAGSRRTGITMEMLTDLPGVQFYTGNGLSEGRRGKDGAVYGPYHGFCLEAGYFPNAVNVPVFPSPVIRAGQRVRRECVYRFGIDIQR